MMTLKRARKRSFCLHTSILHPILHTFCQEVCKHFILLPQAICIPCIPCIPFSKLSYGVYSQIGGAEACQGVIFYTSHNSFSKIGMQGMQVWYNMEIYTYKIRVFFICIPICIPRQEVCKGMQVRSLSETVRNSKKQ